MDNKIKFLSEICAQHRLQEKILLVPSYSVGHQIGENLARNSGSWINLRVTTATGLAMDLATPEMIGKDLRLIDSQESLLILERLLRDDVSKGSAIRYFEGALEIPGLLKLLGRAILDLRMAGQAPADLNPDSFLVQAKGLEIRDILSLYEAFLAENKLVDPPELINLAIKRLNQNKGDDRERIVMALSEFPLAKRERDLIRLAGGGRLIVVPHTRPQGVAVPQRFMGDFPQEGSVPVPLTNIGLLPWILNQEEAPEPFQDDTVQLFRALGDSNEVREVFRRIISAGVAFDTVEIVVTRAEPYVSIIYEISKELDIPVTFGGGIPIGYTRPGRALDLYLEWLLEDFPADGLRRLLAGGYLKREVLKQGEEVLSPGKAAALIREAGIGWGRDRYGSRLNSLEEGYLLRAEELRGEAEEERAVRAERKAVEVSGIEAFVEALLDTVPACSPDDPISMEALARASIEFVRRFCRVAGELDGAAKNALLERLDTFTKTPTFPEPFNRLIERMRGLMGGMTVGHSGPKPGQAHLAHYRSGGYSGRSWTFVLGLDQARFPGPMLQDPVILDRERKELSPALVLSSELLEENLYTLARVLGSIEGRVTLSYSCRDLQEDRERFPSSLLLGAYRLISGNRAGDYSDLKRFLGEPAGFIPEKGNLPLNDWEWWLSLEGTRVDRESILASYPNLEAGETAESERDASTQTEFDGWIPSAEGSMDPLTQDTALSCSRLEALAKCPFAFFLRYVLGIEPLEEMKKDGSQWLDPLQRGELLHAVFCLFMEAMVKRKERPAVKKHGALLAKLAQEEIDRWKEEVPPASPLAFRREEEDIQKALKIFLREEEEHCQKIEPIWLELSFGAGAESGCGTLIKDPVEISLPEGNHHPIRRSSHPPDDQLPFPADSLPLGEPHF